jgi:hypothetical protein
VRRTRGRRVSALLLATLGPVALAGCANAYSFASEVLACKAGDDRVPTNGVILMAQSVPTASWVPCMKALPLGWSFRDMEARNGSASFSLYSDRSDPDGPPTIQVLFTESCATEGASRVPSDREGMVRLERVTQVSPMYISHRFYVFEGGCIAVVFRLTGQDRSEPLAVATQVIGTVPRDDLRDLVREQTDGRLELDPPASEGP